MASGCRTKGLRFEPSHHLLETNQPRLPQRPTIFLAINKLIKTVFPTITQVWCSGRIGPAIFGLSLDLISPKNPKFSNNLPSGSQKPHLIGPKSSWVKAGSAFYLLRVKSMLVSGRVRAHLYFWL